MSLSWKSCEILFSCNVDVNYPFRLQICTCHNSGYVAAYTKFWSDTTINFCFRATRIFTKFRLWAYKLFVKCVAGQSIIYIHMNKNTCVCILFWNVSTRSFSNLLHKFHKASVPYPTMHHFVTEMCACVHISVTKCCVVGYLSDALWDLWDGSYIRHWSESSLCQVMAWCLFGAKPLPAHMLAHCHVVP